MLKSDLVTLLVTQNRLSQKEAEDAVDAVFEAISVALTRGENVEIRDFGSFHVKNYRGYTGRNPSTKAEIQVCPKRGILFRTSKDMKGKLNLKTGLPDD